MRRLVFFPAVPATLLSAFLVACAAGGPADPGAAQGQERPGLVVLIAVDQLRADLLPRYDTLFSGGLRRLMDEGLRFTQASHPFAVTETAAGHATLSTGVLPSRHGIVANNWRADHGAGLRQVYAVEDADAPLVGLDGFEGRSPANFLRDGLPDWMAEAEARTRVVSLSTKDRAAVTLAGRSVGYVYWLVTEAGRYATSTYYRDRDPGWVERFNREVVPGLFTDSVWASVVPPGAARLSRPDTAAYEGDGLHTWFPHHFHHGWAGASGPATFPDRVAWLRGTPFPDQATLRLAQTAMEELELGRRGVTDYLGLSFSQTDYVGHDYGPLSREQLDNLLRLDEVLGGLFDALDERVGRGRWVAAFSADHGVLTMPEWRELHGEPGRRLTRDELAELGAAVEEARARSRDPAGALRAMEEAVEAFPFVAAAYPHSELLSGEPSDSFAPLFRASYHRGRWPGALSHLGLELRLTEGTLPPGYNPTGTTHGSAYWYDRSVPLIFIGAGVAPGVRSDPVYTTDVAPTLARLIGLSIPRDLDGRPLLP